MKVSAKLFCLFIPLFYALAAQGSTPGVPVPEEGEVKVSADLLRSDVEFLSDTLCAGRATGTRGAVEAAAYICRRLVSAGYEPVLQSFRVDGGRVGRNILACAPGLPRKTLVVMASYDGLGVLDGRLYPGADSNASGAAALLSLAARLKDRRDVVFVFLDGHNANLAGASHFLESLGGARPSLVVNLDILGSTLAPVDAYWKDYLIALGAERYARSFASCNSGLQLHLYYDYYRSRSFTDMFYRRIGDHHFFVEKGIPTVMFTSGITMGTNRPTDTAATLDYEVFSRRVEFIARFLETL